MRRCLVDYDGYDPCYDLPRVYLTRYTLSKKDFKALSRFLEYQQRLVDDLNVDIQKITEDRDSWKQRARDQTGQRDSWTAEILPPGPHPPSRPFQLEAHLIQLLKEAHCESYQSVFEEEEVCLSNLLGKSVEDLVREFGMKKTSSERLCRVLKSIQ